MTYSIVGRDPENGQMGVAVQSRYFSVGGTVPWGVAGVGVVATQAFAERRYGPWLLARLQDGERPREALDAQVAVDPQGALRQVAVIDRAGRIAQHTGARCLPAAGHAAGTDCAAQGNMVQGPAVWQGMVAAFERGDGPLALRLMGALEAAEAAGGDLRGRQSAALLIVDGMAGDDPWQPPVLELRVEDHPTPLVELRRLTEYALVHARASTAMAAVMAGESASLADLADCCRLYPDEDGFAFRYGMALLAAGDAAGATRELRRAAAVKGAWPQVARDYVSAGLVPVAAERLETVLAALAP